jgi:UDP-N-acetyl-D-glucosamine dehydrogenase
MTLIDRIKQKTAKVGIKGLGYVGLPLAVTFGEAGFRVVGLEPSEEKINLINAGTSYIGDISSERIAALVRGGLLRATTDNGAAAELDAIIICVPTPLNSTREPDLSFVVNATRDIQPYLHPEQLIVLESTTYPGTTEEILLPILEESGYKVGQELSLAFSPERVDPGSKTHDTRTTPKVIGGVTPACLEKAVALYSQVIDRVVPVSSPRVAEMTKIFENVFRVVNVAVVNELALLCDRMGVSIWEVVDAASTKPFGFMRFQPGPGVGGHCIPVDPFYLTWKAREYDFNTRFVELAGEINVHMPYFVVEKITRALNARQKSVKGSKILILGAAYKPDVADDRESPSHRVMELLEKDGAEVVYNDPFVASCRYTKQKSKQSVDLTDALLREADCVAIVTDHSCYDYQRIVDLAQVVVDTRNATKNVTSGREKISLL